MRNDDSKIIIHYTAYTDRAKFIKAAKEEGYNILQDGRSTNSPMFGQNWIAIDKSINEASTPAVLETPQDIEATAATVKAPNGVEFQTSIIDKSSSYYTPKWAGMVRIQAWVEDPKFEMNHTYWIFVSPEEGRFYSDLDAVVQAPVLNGSDLNFKGDVKNFKSGLKEWLSACVRLSKSKEKERKQKQSKWSY
jgi:hypothetical protein